MSFELINSYFRNDNDSYFNFNEKQTLLKSKLANEYDNLLFDSCISDLIYNYIECCAYYNEIEINTIRSIINNIVDVSYTHINKLKIKLSKSKIVYNRYNTLNINYDDDEDNISYDNDIYNLKFQIYNVNNLILNSLKLLSKLNNL